LVKIFFGGLGAEEAQRDVQQAKVGGRPDLDPPGRATPTSSRTVNRRGGDS
jgi:hypothetical protein